MKNNTLIRVFDALRGNFSIEHMIEAFLEVCANSAGDRLPYEELSCAKYISTPEATAAFQVAASDLLNLPRKARYEALSQLFNALSDLPSSGVYWMHADASSQLIKLVGPAAHVGFNYSWAMRPCLDFAVQAAEAQIKPLVTFRTPDVQHAQFMQRVAAILDLSSQLSVAVAWSWERSAMSAADVEVMVPPMSMTVSAHDKIPERTLASLGLKRDKISRLMAEPLCLADALTMVPGKSIIVTSHAPLFRMVGTETIARETLLESGRLRAIFNLPSRIMFEDTAIEAAILILDAEGQKHPYVRMVDLKHKDVSASGRRGRYETLPGVFWLDLLERENDENSTLLRDVAHNEIRNEKLVLVPSRYLSVSTKNLLEEFLETISHQPLDTLVEFIRPLSIRSDAVGEYTLLESMPSDCGEDGILNAPSRAVSVDAARYNQARHVRLMAGDVVLSVKGNIGPVAVVPDDAPLAGETSVWTIGQSMMILRPRSTTTDPVALYEYLSNEVMQNHLKSLAFGSTSLQSIAMKDLKDLPIALPDIETIETIRNSRSKQANFRQQINDIKEKIESERISHWPHNALKLSGSQPN